jgi:hypothetical protein
MTPTCLWLLSGNPFESRTASHNMRLRRDQTLSPIAWGCAVENLVASIRTWIATWDDDPRPYVWHKTADNSPPHHR